MATKLRSVDQEILFVGALPNIPTTPLNWDSIDTIQREGLLVQNESATILSKKPVHIGPGFLVQSGKRQKLFTSGGGYGSFDAARFRKRFGRRPPEGWKFEYDFGVFSETPIHLGRAHLHQLVEKVWALPFDGITRSGRLRTQSPERIERAADCFDQIPTSPDAKVKEGWAVQTLPDPAIWGGLWRTDNVYRTEEEAMRSMANSERYWRGIRHRVLQIRDVCFVVDKAGRVVMVPMMGRKWVGR